MEICNKKVLMFFSGVSKWKKKGTGDWISIVLNKKIIFKYIKRTRYQYIYILVYTLKILKIGKYLNKQKVFQIQ